MLEGSSPSAFLVVGLFLVAILVARYVVLRALGIAQTQFVRLPERFPHDGWPRRTLARIDRAIDRRAPRLAAFLRARLALDTFRGLPLTVLIAGTVILAALFSEVAEEILDDENVLFIDTFILEALDPLRTAPFVGVFIWITQAGDNATLLIVTIVSSAHLLVGRRHNLLIGLWVTVIGSQTMLWIAKYGFARARPEFITEATALSPSFPSGHTTGAMAIYGFIAYALARQARTDTERWEIVFWAGLLIVLVGFSRMYLHVHYPTDVAAGILTGGIWLLLGIAIAEWTRRAHPAGVP